MSSSNLIRTLAALGALLVFLGAFALFRRSLSDAPVTLDLPALTAADADRVLLAARDTARLTRAAGGAWTVNGQPAARDLVDGLFSALGDSALNTELVARNRASHERLGVDSASARRARFTQGDQVLLDLVFGNRGRGFETVYVRRAGEDDVYLLRGRLATAVDRDAEGWRDRRIATVATDSARVVRVERGRRAYTLAHADSADWRLDGSPADSAAVRRLLGALEEVTASGFAGDAQLDSLDFARPDARLTVTGASGDTLLALAFDSTASGVWVRHAAGGTVYRLDSWRYDQIAPADSTLRAR